MFPAAKHKWDPAAAATVPCDTAVRDESRGQYGLLRIETGSIRLLVVRAAAREPSKQQQYECKEPGQQRVEGPDAWDTLPIDCYRFATLLPNEEYGSFRNSLLNTDNLSRVLRLGHRMNCPPCAPMNASG